MGQGPIVAAGMAAVSRVVTGTGYRRLVWGGAAFLLLLPWLAMKFTGQVDWSPADFAVFGAMLLGACTAYEAAAKHSGSGAYRVAAAVAIATAFFLVWVTLAVGIIGSERNPANLVYGGVLVVALAGALVARLRPRGMMRAMTATAGAQALVAVLVLSSGRGGESLLTMLFVVPWLVSARLFRKAAQEEVAR